VQLSELGGGAIAPIAPSLASRLHCVCLFLHSILTV